jgi:uncharacterized protein YpuA (DUF1002 family)
MKKTLKKVMSIIMAAAIAITPAASVYAESVPVAISDTEGSAIEEKVQITEDDKPYLALGADLTADQQNTVLALMGVDASKLDEYDVVYITNDEEHKYLDSYVSSSQIGTKSLSSVLIVQRPSGNGVNISTYNINYCTAGMYQNAIATAGITDADIIVAGPTSISGTAALVGVFKAYQEMTGEKIDEDVIDTAMNELVITGELEDTIKGLDDEEVEEFMAYLKGVIAQGGFKDESSIKKAIDEACEKYGVTLDSDEYDKLLSLLTRFSSLDSATLNKLVDYAENMYGIIKNGGSLTSSGIGGAVTTVKEFFTNLFTGIGEFFKNLF